MNKVLLRVVWLHTRNLLIVLTTLCAVGAVVNVVRVIDLWILARWHIGWGNVIAIDFGFLFALFLVWLFFGEIVSDYFYCVRRDAEEQLQAEETSAGARETLLRGSGGPGRGTS